jgi:hypothetical protein
MFIWPYDNIGLQSPSHLHTFYIIYISLISINSYNNFSCIHLRVLFHTLGPFALSVRHRIIQYFPCSHSMRFSIRLPFSFSNVRDLFWIHLISHYILQSSGHIWLVFESHPHPRKVFFLDMLHSICCLRKVGQSHSRWSTFRLAPQSPHSGNELRST